MSSRRKLHPQMALLVAAMAVPTACQKERESNRSSPEDGAGDSDHLTEALATINGDAPANDTATAAAAATAADASSAATATSEATAPAAADERTIDVNQATDFSENSTPLNHTENPPPEVRNLELRGLSNSSIRVSWDTGGGSTFGFIVALRHNYVPNDCTVGYDAHFSESMTLTGLIPGDTYGFRVCAYDIYGTLSDGRTISGTLEPGDLLPAEVTNLNAEGWSPTELRVTWNDPGGTTEGFQIAIRRGFTPPATCNGIDVGSSTSYTYSGLEPNTYYSVRVCTYDDNHLLSEGRTDSDRTLLAAPPAPTGLAVEGLTYESIRARWNSGGGSTVGFRIKMIAGSTPPTSCDGAEWVGDATSKTYVGLNPNAPYSVRVCAVNDDGVRTPAVATGSTLPYMPTLQSVPVCHTGLSFLVTGAGAGGGPHAIVRAGPGLPEVASAFPFIPTFQGGIRVAMADIDRDGFMDTVVAPGPTGGPHVEVFSGRTGEVIRGFFAYDQSVTNGIFVAAGDVNGDGTPDIITSVDKGAGPHIKAFNGIDLSLLQSFFAYDPGFRGGVRVAAADINGDGYDDIITGAGPGGGPHVQVFSGRDGQSIRSFFAYDPSFSLGIFVAAGDVNGDGRMDIVTGAGPGGGPHVRAFSGLDEAVLANFFAYEPTFSGGLFVAAADLTGDGKADLITGAGPGGGPHVQVFDSATGSSVHSFFAYDPSFAGGVTVAGATCR